MAKVNVIALSFPDLTKPFRGSARLYLSSLGSLALEGHRVTYLRLTNRSRGSYKVRVTDCSKKTDIYIRDIPIRRISSLGQFEYAKLSSIISQMVREGCDNEPDVIICEKRHLYTLCSRLSKLLRCPWVIRVDAFKSLHARQRFCWTRDYKELFVAPIARVIYLWITLHADLGICVSKTLENWLRLFYIHNICTIEPTYLTISHDTPSGKIDEILGSPDQDWDPVIYIGKPRLLLAIALRTPDIGYAAIGFGYNDLRAVAQRCNIKTPSNITCLHLIEDSLLARIYQKAKLALIPRPFLSGVSMASIEALYYGKPIITNRPAARALEGFATSGAAIVENDFSDWPFLVKKLYYNDDLRSSMGDSARNYFNFNLSPKIHASRMEAVLTRSINRKADSRHFQKSTLIV